VDQSDPNFLKVTPKHLDPASYLYLVENNVPVPEPLKTGGPGTGIMKRMSIPWPLMKVGDDSSVFIPASDFKAIDSPAIAIAQGVGTRQKNHDEKYTFRTRRQDLHGEEGWRIWRTA
jgi:hypothetical protein